MHGKHIITKNKRLNFLLENLACRHELMEKTLVLYTSKKMKAKAFI